MEHISRDQGGKKLPAHPAIINEPHEEEDRDFGTGSVSAYAYALRQPFPMTSQFPGTVSHWPTPGGPPTEQGGTHRLM